MQSENFNILTALFVFTMKQSNRKIVEFIRDQYLIDEENNSKFAKEHFIDEKTVRRIREDETYQISIITIMRICEGKELKLSEFFKMVGI